MLARLFQTVYPSRCLACGEEVLNDAALCPGCWPDAHFVSGTACESCGVPVPATRENGGPNICESCHLDPPPWAKGRAVALYDGPVRRMVMALKHGDRLDLVPKMAGWMSAAGDDLITPATVLAPVPLHWTRLLRRRYNQAALLAAQVAHMTGGRHVPDLLQRTRATGQQRDMDRSERFQNQRTAIRPHPGRHRLLAGAQVLIVDDVMTTGATLTACTEALLAAGAARVDVLVFARVARAE
ncbi:MAG: ComF family protein [Pseudomonadota bacterium]